MVLFFFLLHIGPSRPDCWFCLASSDAETHLVVSVAEECYLAMAKGAFNAHHTIILPIAHMASITAVSPEASVELKRFE